MRYEKHETKRAQVRDQDEYVRRERTCIYRHHGVKARRICHRAVNLFNTCFASFSCPALKLANVVGSSIRSLPTTIQIACSFAPDGLVRGSLCNSGVGRLFFTQYSDRIEGVGMNQRKFGMNDETHIPKS